MTDAESIEAAYREGFTDGYNVGLSDGHPLNRAGERGTYAEWWDASITKQKIDEGRTRLEAGHE